MHVFKAGDRVRVIDFRDDATASSDERSDRTRVEWIGRMVTIQEVYKEYEFGILLKEERAHAWPARWLQSPSLSSLVDRYRKEVSGPS